MASVEREDVSSTDEGEREEGGRGEGGGREDEREEEGELKVKKSGDTSEGERGGETKKKKKQLPSLDSEDDEPPPPYSPTDPQEKKSKQGAGDNIPPVEPPRKSSSADVKAGLDSTSKKTGREGDRRGSLSPLQLSRISSPPRGLSLSELTRVTPEDQERWRQSRESLERQQSHESLTEIHNRSSLPRSRFGGSLELHSSHRVHDVPTQRKQSEGGGCGLGGRGLDGRGLDGRDFEGRDQSLLPVPGPQQEVGGDDDHAQIESSSDTTLVGSQSQSDTGLMLLPESENVKEKKGKKGKLQPRLEPVGKKKKNQRSPKAGHSKSAGKGSAEPASTLSVSSSHVSMYIHVHVYTACCTLSCALHMQ